MKTWLKGGLIGVFILFILYGIIHVLGLLPQMVGLTHIFWLAGFGFSIGPIYEIPISFLVGILVNRYLNKKKK